MAMGAYAVLMLLAWTTLDDQRFRLATIAVLALVDFKTALNWPRSQQHKSEVDRPM